MKNITRTQYQAFPFHLVEPSPWPILTSFALLTLTVSAVLYFHGFVNGGELLTLGFILVSGGMVLWFRDVITEGTKKICSILTTSKALSKELRIIHSENGKVTIALLIVVAFFYIGYAQLNFFSIEFISGLFVSSVLPSAAALLIGFL
jgi:hypothetical protein